MQQHLQGLSFPEAMPLVMRAERTFWEKATAIHVFCKQGAFRGGDRIARHWQDVTRLDAAGCADRSLADEELAKAVADHMNSFFPEKCPDGTWIDHHTAIAGGLGSSPALPAVGTTDDFEGTKKKGLRAFLL
jgi:hypothetical protein